MQLAFQKIFEWGNLAIRIETGDYRLAPQGVPHGLKLFVNAVSKNKFPAVATMVLSEMASLLISPAVEAETMEAVG